MTHRYSLLIGGTILPGRGEPQHSAIAWAEGIVLALGTDEQIRAISRGDSELFDLSGAFVVPLGADDTVAWPALATLEVGSPADLAILGYDPRTGRGDPPRIVGVIRGGHVVRGSLPGA